MCPPGTFQTEEGQQQCDECKDGYYNPTPNGVTCLSCPEGQISNNSHTECVNCPVGTCQPEEGGGICRPCGVGQFNDKDGASACTDCPAGFFQDQIGQIFCNPCKEGTFSSGNRTMKCEQCTAGYYCPTPATITPTICPAGSMCPTGSSSPTECSLLHVSKEGAESCDLHWSFFLIVGSSIILSIAVAVIVIFVFARQKKKAPSAQPYVCVATPPLTQKTTSGARVVVDGDIKDIDQCDDIQSTVIPEDDGPVYSGL